MNDLRFQAAVLFAISLHAMACGGSASKTSSDPIELCNQICGTGSALCVAKEVAVTLDALCRSNCTTQFRAVASCKNVADIVAGLQRCTDEKTCVGIGTCAFTVPACLDADLGTGKFGVPGEAAGRF